MPGMDQGLVIVIADRENADGAQHFAAHGHASEPDAANAAQQDRRARHEGNRRVVRDPQQAPHEAGGHYTTRSGTLAPALRNRTAFSTHSSSIEARVSTVEVALCGVR